MKTKGQRLYEHENPKFVTVVLYSDTFRQNPFTVPNPEEPVDWKFLTAACRETYERRAVGHNLFSGDIDVEDQRG